MAPKAPRIPASTWEKYKDEITTLYTRPEPEGTLAKTMKFMQETHGFEATKNQYTAKVKTWGLEKYANHNIWAYVDQMIRKRKAEGKDSETIIRGIKKLRSSVEKNIARNVTRMDQLQRQKTPEGVEVVTPGAEAMSSNPVAVREVEIENLPWFQLLEDMQRVIFMDNGIPRVSSALGQPNDPFGILDGSLFTANLLQMALGRDRVKLISSETALSYGHSGPNDLTPVLVSGGWRKNNNIPLMSYLPPSGTSDVMPSLSAIRSLGIPPQFVAHLSFLQSFIYLTNNAILGEPKGDGVIEGIIWLLDNIDYRLFSYLFSLQTTSIKIFMVKIVPAVIKYGNIKLAQDVIDWIIKHDVRPSRSSMRKCMRIAAINGDTKMVELLCRAKFQLCIAMKSLRRDEEHTGWLPWNKGNIEVLKTLLSFQADPDYLCEGERGLALIGAARSGNLEAVNILLEAGCRVNLFAEYSFGTALQAAVCGEHSNIVEILIRYGADVNTECARGSNTHFLSSHTPLQTAWRNGNTSIVDMLLAHGASAELDLNFENGLHRCVRDGNISLLRELLGHRCNPNFRARPDFINAQLQTAACYDYPEIVQELIKYGADVDISPERDSGRTALQHAAESGSIQIIEMLVANGANVNAPPCRKEGLTALQAAIKMGRFSIAKFLLTLGAEINAPPCDIGGFTAIQAAAYTGDLNMIQYLLCRGADLNGPEAEIEGTSVLAAAMRHKDLRMVKFLVENGAKICGLKKHKSKPPIVAAAENRWVHGVRYLLEKRADVNSYAADYEQSRAKYNCALQCAIANKHVEMVQLLLEHGAHLHIHYTEKFKVTALHYALLRGCSYSDGVIQLLLQCYVKSGHTIFDEDILASAVGAAITTQDTKVLRLILKVISQFPSDQNKTQNTKAWENNLEYIDDTEDHPEELTLEVTKLLLSAGADVNSRVKFKITFEDINDEPTLLQHVARCGRVGLAKLALKEGADIQVPASEWTGTPLQEAIKNDNVELVNILLERNPDVNSPPAEVMGRTALQAAATRGHMEIAIELLRRGAHVAAPAADEEGITAINGAASEGREDMLQLLLNHYDGCQPLDAVCKEAAIYADEKEHFIIGQWLREYCKVES